MESVKKLSISTAKLPDSIQQTPYSFQLESDGGNGEPKKWKLESGSFPPGISLAENGLLSGQTDAIGSFPVNISVTDGVQTAYKNL